MKAGKYGVQNVPELMVREGKEEGGRLIHSKDAGNRSKREFKDSEELVQWKSINQEEVDHLWKDLFREMEEEVLEM